MSIKTKLNLLPPPEGIWYTPINPNEDMQFVVLWISKNANIHVHRTIAAAIEDAKDYGFTNVLVVSGNTPLWKIDISQEQEQSV